MYIGSSCYNPLAHWDQIAKTNIRVLEVATTLVVIGKTKRKTYDSRKHKLVKYRRKYL